MATKKGLEPGHNNVVPVSTVGITQLSRSVQIIDSDVNEGVKPVAAFLTEDSDTLSIQMEVLTNALDQFEIHYKYSEEGEYINMGVIATDYTTPAYPVLAASGSFLTAAVGNGHYVKLDVSGIYAVQLWAASGNAAGSEIIFNGSTK